jgi:hypothetical protein
MKDIFLFVLLGLGGGAVIAGIAMAVVLTYRGSGIINLATGAVAMVAAFAFWALRNGFFGPTVPEVPAIAITMAAAVLVGVLSELLVFRPLRTSSPLAKLVASLGILLVLQATVLLWFGQAPKQIPSVFPTNIVDVAGTSIPANRFWMTGVVIALALAPSSVGPGSAGRRGQHRRTKCSRCSPGCHPTSSRWSTRCWRPPSPGRWASSPRRSRRPTRSRWCCSSSRPSPRRCSVGSRRCRSRASPASRSASASR